VIEKGISEAIILLIRELSELRDSTRKEKKESKTLSIEKNTLLSDL